MKFKCNCNSPEFKSLITYKGIQKERFFCKNCNKVYEKNRGYIKELDLKKIWEDGIVQSGLKRSMPEEMEK